MISGIKNCILFTGLYIIFGYTDGTASDYYLLQKTLFIAIFPLCEVLYLLLQLKFYC